MDEPLFTVIVVKPEVPFTKVQLVLTPSIVTVR